MSGTEQGSDSLAHLSELVKWPSIAPKFRGPFRGRTPVQACQPASATVHGDVLSHASNGHAEQAKDSPSSSFPSLDIATGFDVSYEPIMGVPLPLVCPHSISLKDRL